MRQFKDCICSWSLGINRFKNYVYLLHWESARGPFLLHWESARSENFYQEYVVITLEAVNERDEDSSHLHSIVVKIGDGVVSFDIHSFLQILARTLMEVLQPELESKYVP